MKTSIPILLPCLLFACIFNFSLAADSVLDTSGQAVRNGVNYYILSAGDGRGLMPAKGENSTCPFEVVQTLDAGARGFPLQFSPVNSTDGTVHEDADVTIKFTPSDYTSGCPQSTAWLLQDFFVTTGGDEKGTGASLFTIRRYEDAYALQFCPRVTGCSLVCPRLPPCGYIGIEVVNGRRRLAMNRPALKIALQKD